jgi:lysophospholipase L1-like esterase
MKSTALLTAVLISGAATVASAQSRPAAATVDDQPWASDIAAFRNADRLHFPKPGGIVFVGSSSIVFWPHLSTDFPGENVIQRGFGGSELGDVVYRAPTIVIPYKPRLVVLYAGDNDLANGRTPQDVLAQFKQFVKVVHDSLPHARIAFISIKPSWARVALLDKMRAANDLVRSYISTQPNLTYVDVFTPMLGPAGKPRMALLDPTDSLHLNETGYKLWRHLLMPVIKATHVSRP